MESRVEEIFAIALEKEGDERVAYVEEACGDDMEVRREVEGMLADAERAEDLFGGELTQAATIGGGSVGLGDDLGQIGPYELKGKLGEGGFGVVWLAEQKEPIARTVAIKVVKVGMDTEDVLRRFEAERQALALMDHPGIAKVLDAGATELGRPYFVMELVDGVPITKFCDERKLHIPERLAIFREVCSAVNHAHQKGIIHRDLKPSNVMVTENGGKPAVKVIDFGIAKATEQKLTEETLQTRQGQFIGTPVYMSPEQAARGAGDVDTRSDIYSLGVLLYELLSGRPPFDSKSLLSAGYDEMRRIIHEDDPPKLSRRLDTVSEDERAHVTVTHGAEPRRLSRLLKGELEWIVMKALEKDRSRRYGTAVAFEEDLGRFLASEPVQAAAPSVTYRMRKFARPNKATVGTATLIAVVLVVAMVVSVVSAGRAKEAEEHALAKSEESRRAFAKAQIAVASAAFRDAERGTMVRALKAVPEDLRDQSWHYLAAKLDSALGPLNLADLGEIASVMAVPGAPTTFAVAARSGTVVLVDVQSGERIMTMKMQLRGSVVLGFRADGALMAVTARGAKDIHLVRVADGTLVRKIPAPSKDIRQLCFAPDGRSIATRDHNKPPQHLCLVDVETGELRWRKPAQLAAVAFSADGSRIFSISINPRKFRVWNAATGDLDDERTRPFHGHALALSPDGERLALGLSEGSVVILDAETGEQVTRRRLDFGGVDSLAWTARGHLLTLDSQGGLGRSGRYRRVLRLWEAGEFSKRGAFFGMEFGPRKGSGWAFQPASGYLLTNGSPPELWHMPVDLEVARIPSHTERGWSVSFLDCLRLFGRKGWALAPYDLSDAAQPQELPSPARYGENLCAVHWKKKLLVTAPRSGWKSTPLKLYAIQDSELSLIGEIKVPGMGTRVDIDPDAKRILFVSFEGFTRLFAAESGEELQKLRYRLWRGGFTGNGDQIVGLCPRTDDELQPMDALVFYDSLTGDIIEELHTEGRLSELVASPDRRLVAVSGGDGNVRIYDARSREERFRFLAHESDITAMAFHPTAPILATASTDGSLKLWDYETATQRRVYYGIDGRPVMIAFSPDGRFLALEAQEKHLRIYDLSLDTHPGEPLALDKAR